MASEEVDMATERRTSAHRQIRVTARIRDDVLDNGIDGVLSLRSISDENRAAASSCWFRGEDRVRGVSRFEVAA